MNVTLCHACILRSVDRILQWNILKINVNVVNKLNKMCMEYLLLIQVQMPCLNHNL